MCLVFLVYKGPTMKLGSRCRESEIQFSGPALRSLANFYIELVQFCCSLSAAKACIWTINHRFLKCFSKFQSWSTDPTFLCADHDLARIRYQEQYFHACTLWATQARVGGGRVKKVFFQDISFWTANWNFWIVFQTMGAYFEQTQKINSIAQGNQKLTACGDSMAITTKNDEHAMVRSGPRAHFCFRM